ncbi:uncharacterized protein YutD [Enterococcus sp. PF1-24]|uniref:YutD family protein n=1 Tax=unclassified Enterococcus TaxID=2608891 RepID=UPI0024769426|nr:MULTISPECIES: YutD family protein [unclassified Enterococcus]MDH6365363.1 uncharacterized protein YutD [Enterococcus sp. PFB1-1]MDH6402464.1 uncharacterized protein YutD [Enterococcus sp. PF1-24]
MVKQVPNKNEAEKKTVTEEITAVLSEIVQEAPEEKKKGEVVQVLADGELLIGERQYRLVANHRDGFEPERLGERFSEVLSRYDYVVGDWGYDQLRLKGFFTADNRKALPEQRIDTLEDYLYEFCNFGCAYFVIERVGGKRERKQTRRRRSNNKKPMGEAHIEEKKAPVKPIEKTKPVIKNRKPKAVENKKAPVKKQPAEKATGFVIRKRGE